MAKKKYEFRPDKPVNGLLSKLSLTRKQRMSLLKWGLYALVLLVLSVVQDVILCKVDIFGATPELLPCAILLMGIYQGVETGSVFCLTAAALYQFSGAAAGYYDIVIITALTVAAAMFRQTYLRKSVSSDILCTLVTLFLYKFLHFGIGLVFQLVPPSRIVTFFISTLLTALLIPVLYPITVTIDRIGGETWKE